MNLFYRDPDHPNFNRRARHHNYTQPARYLITLRKNPMIPSLSTIDGQPYSEESANISVVLTPAGELVARAIEEWKGKFWMYIPAYVVMPDHIHLCVDVVGTLPTGLSRAVASLMGMISKLYHLSLPFEKRSPVITPFFTKGYNDRIAYTPDQWHNQIQYTNDNPRRYLIKKHYPNYLFDRWMLTMSPERRFVLRGNIFLLKQPYLFRVKTSSRFTTVEAEEATREWRKHLCNGGIPISPFIHPHEKAFRNEVIEKGYAYIRVCTNGFGEREAPHGIEFEMMAQGRMLLIGQEQFCTRKETLKYSFASTLNKLSLEIAEAANRGVKFSIRQIR